MLAQFDTKASVLWNWSQYHLNRMHLFSRLTKVGVSVTMVSVLSRLWIGMIFLAICSRVWIADCTDTCCMLGWPNAALSVFLLLVHIRLRCPAASAADCGPKLFNTNTLCTLGSLQPGCPEISLLLILLFFVWNIFVLVSNCTDFGFEMLTAVSQGGQYLSKYRLWGPLVLGVGLFDAGGVWYRNSVYFGSEVNILRFIALTYCLFFTW